MPKAFAFEKIIFYCCFIALLINPHIVIAQDTTTADGLFQRARQTAFKENNYLDAIDYCKKALLLAPKYTDIKTFLGRLYTWNKNYDSARKYFQEVISEKPNEDAYTAYGSLEFWNKKYYEALIIVNNGITYFPRSPALLLLKTKLLIEKKDFTSATRVIDTLLQIDKNNTEVRALSSQIRDNVASNRVGICYDYVYFDKQFQNPWHLVSIDYTRQSQAGAYTARINYANRFNNNGLQYEIETYPRISKTFYSYADIGYSDNATVFPKWKGGLSLCTNLPKAFETEIGLRYLFFTTSTFIYTVYIGKYYKSFLFGARTYLSPSSANISQTYSLIARYYYAGVDDYVGLNTGAGISPDDRETNVQLNSNYKLRTYRIELLYRHAIRKLNIITFDASVLNQEYLPGITGNQIQAGLGYIRRF